MAATDSPLVAFKNFLHPSTRRVMPCVFLCEAATTLWVWVNIPSLVTDNCWFFASGLGSVAILALLETRQKLPLPFVNHLPMKDCLCIFGISFLAAFTARVLGLSVQAFPEIASLAHLSCRIAFDVNVGITEESGKIVLTNGAALALRRMLGDARWNMLGRFIVLATGSGAVVLWVWMHPLRSYGVGYFVSLLVSGIAYFLLIFWKRNYLPIVATHALYDFIFAPF